MENIVVSIVCNTYNHEKYIAQCLDGFIMQKTNFTFEVLVHDDASTDDTAAIIREYERKYPHIIKPIYQTENQYSKGSWALIGSYQYSRVRGKYCTLCEGDDYWTDPYKLQKQFDAMEAHPEIDICAHATEVIDASTGEVCRMIAPRSENCIIPAGDVIIGEGGFVATNSLFYRTEIMWPENQPAFRKMWIIDYTLQIQGSLRGGMLYLSDCMSAYRYMVPGSWTAGQKVDLEKQRKTLDDKRAMLEQLDKDTQGACRKAIDERMRMNDYASFLLYDDYRRVIARKYRESFREEPLTARLKAYLKTICPWIYRMRNGAANRQKKK